MLYIRHSFRRNINFIWSCNDSVSDGQESGKSLSSTPMTTLLYRLTKINILFESRPFRKKDTISLYFHGENSGQITKHKGPQQKPCSHELSPLNQGLPRMAISLLADQLIPLTECSVRKLSSLEKPWTLKLKNTKNIYLLIISKVVIFILVTGNKDLKLHVKAK